jgi:hypothetical protein
VAGDWDGGSGEVVEKLLGSGDAVAILRVSYVSCGGESQVGVVGVWSWELGEGAGNSGRHSLLGGFCIHDPPATCSAIIILRQNMYQCFTRYTLC